MNIESKVTAKGQTTIPQEVREALGVGPGDRIRYVLLGEGKVELVPRNRPVATIFGKLSKFAIRGTSLDDYKNAVASGHEKGLNEGGGE